MAEKILDAILGQFLTVDNLLDWLSNKNQIKQDGSDPLMQYECSQVEFVSYFLMFLRQQSSRDFQVYDTETPRKNSYTRKYKNINTTEKTSSPVRCFQNSSSFCSDQLDLDSLQSFPNLSSCSSINVDSCGKKLSEITPNAEFNLKGNSEKKIRRVKLFSETFDNNFKGGNASKKDIKLLDDIDGKMEIKFSASTPKYQALPITDSLNSLDLQNASPKFLPKQQWKNHSSDLSSPEVNSSTPKARSFSGDSCGHRNKDNKINCRMSLGDYISNEINSSDVRKEKRGKTRKRIHSVRISSQSPFTGKTDESLDSLDEGSVLKVNIDHKTSKKEVDSGKDIENVNMNLDSSCEMQPDLDNTTFTNDLKILSQIYSFLITENFCQNITMELCFIISLLVIQNCDKKTLESELDTRNKKYFGSVHNCVYFAVETLWLQRNCLLMLNLSALKLLSENVRIEKFNGKLKEFLMDAYSDKKSKEELRRHTTHLKTGMQGNVSFQYETDNRENFTSDLSFHAFRKQRDLFYNILAIWEANHLVSGWIFSIGLGSKIRSLLSISSDPINLLHLARLFRNQLIMSCCGENQTQEDLNEKIFQLLPSADPNKIMRLRARLTSSPKRQGPCPLPDFTGHQEFYKDFILCMNQSAFHDHLKNSLCDEILRMNDMTDLTGDNDYEEASLDVQTEERYLHNTNILRLLAKFLGFLEFMPYRGEKSYSDRIFNIHCSVRHNTLPIFDMTECLQSAVKKQKLTLTVPWIVSYLSMIDPYSARLDAYRRVWRFLIIIYKHLNSLKSAKNRFYLKLTLGWIFQLPNFPPDQFYTILCDSNKFSSELWLENDEKQGLDSFDLLQEDTLYTLCPYLNEINVVLSENSGCNVRHIRPVTTNESSLTNTQASRQLQLRLESNFLHNQSSSTRKTVEFVTERVASIVIKHLVYNVVPKMKDATVAELDTLTVQNLEEAELASENLSNSYYQELVRACERENWKISWKRSEIALKALLSSDTQKSVVETCSKIVARQATEKVERWMQSHVTLAMVRKEFVTSVRKKFAKKNSEVTQVSGMAGECSETGSSKAPSRPMSRPEDEGTQQGDGHSAWPASETIKAIRELICRLREGQVDSEQVHSLIEEVIRTVKHRNDLIPVAEKALLSLTVDLVIMHCIYADDVDLSREITKTFFLLLKRQGCDTITNLERIICPRNVKLISKKRKGAERAWNNLGNLLLALLDQDLLTKDQIEPQLLSLFRYDYDKEERDQYLKFISEILEKYSSKNGCDKFSLLLQYMIETLNDDECMSDDLI